jgi:hypothetical protein
MWCRTSSVEMFRGRKIKDRKTRADKNVRPTDCFAFRTRSERAGDDRFGFAVFGLHPPPPVMFDQIHAALGAP